MQPLTDKEFRKLIEQEPRLGAYLKKNFIEGMSFRLARAHAERTKAGIAAAKKRKAEEKRHTIA